MIPAIAILIGGLTIFIAVLQKFSTEELLKLCEGKNFVLTLAFLLFGTLLVVHLFKDQPWTADVLKILAGILVGAASASSASAGSQTAIGTNIKQAMRDLIEEVNGDIQEIKDSVVNQYATINESLSDLNDVVGSPVIRRTERFRVEANDEDFIEELQQIRIAGGDWTTVWMDRCIEHAEIRAKIDQKIRQLNAEGWRVASMDLDNHGNGLHINLEVQKKYGS